jgi:hypothetical protein
LDEVLGDGFELLVRAAEAEFSQSGLGGVDRATRAEQAEQKGLSLLGIASLVGRRQAWGTELAAASAGDLQLQRDTAEPDGAVVEAVGFIVGGAGQESATLGFAECVEQGGEELAEVQLTEPAGQGFIDFLLYGLRQWRW